MDEKVVNAAAALEAALRQQPLPQTPVRRIPPPAPGIYAGVPMATYLAWDCLSHSVIEPLVTWSPERAKWLMERASKQTDAMRLGSAIHCAALEPHVFESTYRSVPKPWTGSSNKAERRRLIKQGFEVISPEEHETCVKARANLRKHPDFAPLFADQFRAEFCIVFTIETSWGPIVCKCRPDLWSPRYEIMVDVKSTADPRPRAFLSVVRMFGYHRKVVFYAMGARAVGLPCASVILAAVKSGETCDVKPYWFDEAVHERAHDEIMGAAELYAMSKATGTWVALEPSGYEVTEEQVYGRRTE